MNEQDRLPLRVKVCYGIGHLGNMLLLLLNAVFLLYFYTDVIGISARAAAIIILIARLWDAFNDPLMGALVDKKEHKGGKCRYFLKLFAVPAGICVALSYFVPGLRGSVKILWVAVTYILQGMAQTAVSVPLFTMMARLSSNQVERAKLGQFQSIASILANLLVPAVTLPMATAIGGENLQLGFSAVAVIYGIAFAACFLICWAGTAGYEKEPEVQEENAPKVTLREIGRALCHNKVALLVALCYLMYCVYSTLMGSSLLYYLTYNLKNTDLMSVYSVLSTVTGFAPILLMVVLGGMGSLTGSMVAAVVMFLVNYQIKNGAWVELLPAAVQGVFTYPMLVYAAVLIVVILFRPKGIFGTYEFSLIHLGRDLKAARAAKAAAKAERKEANIHA